MVKRHNPAEIAAKLRQVDVPTSQGAHDVYFCAAIVGRRSGSMGALPGVFPPIIVAS